MTRIRDLLDLPETVHKSDFVQSLSSGIDHPAQTIRDYAVTDAILQTFEHAFSIVNSAVAGQRSQAAYLHGSFGSGKSHFMAVFSLMLSNHEEAWERAEFHKLKADNPWLGTRKFLQLPMHFLGARSIEEKIFDTYVRWLAKHHPEAAVPALYADQALFDMAEQHRVRRGDAAFFAELNQGKQVSSGWGDLAETATWDGPRFEATLRGSHVLDREELFSDLVRNLFPAFTSQANRFIELDRGLQVLSRHAAGLGYDGVVLYLDELILWLASSASDLAFIQRETQKLVKLKESQNDQRDIPIVSFIARQRDLAQLVGEQARGDERAALEDSMKHHSGRFDTVVLADSNLPAIVEHRVLQAKNPAAQETLRDGFAAAWRKAGLAKSTLIGTVGSEAAFRQVFPFSPALVEALVALSDCLQRERTAIRILMELLVEHLPDLELGPVVPVGDTFDVIAGGEEPFDQAMRARFERARSLYQDSFLPLIQADHGTQSPDACQRLRSDHPKRLGCSGCQKMACRNDNRLAKTLLMAALVPEAPTFKGLTVKRLVHLNHGTIASPIPGAEVQLAAQKLRRWDAQIGPLRVGDQSDPELTLHLEGVDLAPIIDKARQFDTPGARKTALRKLLFGTDGLGLPTDSTTVEYTVEYRGIRRLGTVRFGNVREMSDGQLSCPNGSEWQVVYDYPFDAAGSPLDDIQRVEQYREAHPGREEPTLVWLPTFFSHDMEQTLGDMVAIQHILDGRTSEYLGGLRAEDRVQAQGDLRSLRDQKQDQLLRALGAAYGLTSSANNPALDPSRAVDEHVLPLATSLPIAGLLAGTLKQGLESTVQRLLEHRYPQHPDFRSTVTNGKLDRVNTLITRVLEAPDRRMPVTAQDRKELQHFSDPLGLTHTTDGASLLQEQTFVDLDQLRQRAGLEVPTVADVRGYTDPQGYRGLTPPVQDLVVWNYAQWCGRSVVQGGREVELRKLGQLPEDAELILPELPTTTEWHAALKSAAELFGVTFANRHLNARNLTSFCERVKTQAAKSRDALGLANNLEARLDEWGDKHTAPRLLTARSASSLIDAVDLNDRADLVRALAAFVAESSATAVSKSLTTTPSVNTALSSEARWLNFHSVGALLTDPQKSGRAQGILDDLAKALQADELNSGLVAALADLTKRAAELLKKPQAGTWQIAHSRNTELAGRAGYAESLAALAQEFTERAAGQADSDEVKLQVQLVLVRRKKPTSGS